MIYQMFAIVVLTAVVLALLLRSRIGAVREGLVSAAYFRVYQGGVEPESSAKVLHAYVHLGSNRLHIESTGLPCRGAGHR